MAKANRRHFIAGLIGALLLLLQAPMSASAAGFEVIPYLADSGTATVATYSVTRSTSSGTVFEFESSYAVLNGSVTLLITPGTSSILIDIQYGADFTAPAYETTTITGYDAGDNVVGTAVFASIDSSGYLQVFSAPAVKIVVDQVKGGTGSGATKVILSLPSSDCDGPGNAYGNKNRVGCGAPGQVKKES